jgi:superfamily II DNA or RNA helicase
LQESRTPLAAGDPVEVRDASWTILSIERFEHVTLLTLRGIGVENLNRSQRVLLPFDHAKPIVNKTAIGRASRDAVLQAAAAALAGTASWSECWTAGSARIDLRPWQLEPARAAIAGASRLLLADDVGLGKTIQAGLILAELTVRGLAQRVLVLTPASLRAQWAAELSAKFGLVAAVFDSSALAEAAAKLPFGVNPWKTASVIVSSIDLVKRSEVRSALDEVPFDVLVVDEAHHLTPGSDRSALVVDLAARTPWLVLATATPHSGDEAAYRFLQHLGAEPTPLVTFCRRATDVDDRRLRRDLWLGVRPTSDEHLLLNATLRYQQVLRVSGGDQAAYLVATVIARRAASLAAAAHRTLERRLALLKGAAHETQEPLPWDEGDGLDGMVSDQVLGVRGMPNCTEELAWLDRLVGMARAAANRSSKLRILERLVRRSREPLIVFSEFRDVAIDVADRLSSLTSVALIHGGVPARDRHDRIREFIRGNTRILVTTDAAGEGLNLQARCRLVVNLELPWNPWRLEQRVGRVDRIGQQHRVHALHLYYRDSFEEVVRAGLDRRRRAATNAIRASTPGTARPFAHVERWLSEHGGSAPYMSQPLYCEEPLFDANPGVVVLLFGSNYLDGVGRIVQRDCIGVRVELLEQHSAERWLTREMIDALTRESKVRAVLDSAVRARLLVAQSEAIHTADAVERRIGRIRLAIQGRSNFAFQGSLFDRRAEQQARVRTEHSKSLLSQLARNFDSARGLRCLRATDPQLVAAWVAR